MERKKIESKKANTNNSGIVKDENGYYKIVLGALNTYNFHGMFYRIDDLDKILKNEKSMLTRRIKMGILRAEYEHPSFKGMTKEEVISRLMTIDINRVCAHIKSVEFINTGKTEKGWEDYPIYLVVGWVKPTGPYGKYLQEALDNPDENVSFSIRSLVREQLIGSTIVRDLVDISTWDFVFEQGVTIANQWYAAGIENVNSGSDMGLCVDGVCIPKLKDIMHGNEDIASYVENLIEQMKYEDKTSNSILAW